MDLLENKIIDDDILELAGIDKAREEVWNKYYHEKIGPVPRVTNIISQCRNSEGLIQWAANVGRKKYDYFRGKALDIGTISHELIDEYLTSMVNGKDYSVDYSLIRDDYRSSVFNCIENFKLWCSNLKSLGYNIEEVVGLEIPVTCPYYGGTIDGIVRINGAYYIIDFKTSKKISTEYLIQTSAYMWIINNGYMPELPHINGIGIIRVDKTKLGSYNDYFLNEYDPIQYNMIINFQNCFFSYVEAYYRTINTEYIADNYPYNLENVLKGV